MMLWKCFLHGTRHVFLSFYPCQGTWVGFLLEPHHSIEINSAPQQAVCQKAGTAVRKAGAQLWSQRQFHRPQRQLPHTALHPFLGSEASDRSWQGKHTDCWPCCRQTELPLLSFDFPEPEPEGRGSLTFFFSSIPHCRAHLEGALGEYQMQKKGKYIINKTVAESCHQQPGRKIASLVKSN